MITITRQNDGVLFEFEDSKKYLYGNGSILVPFNTLSIVADESDMITLKKAASNDVFLSARYDTDFGYRSKDDAIDDLKDLLFAETGGGGGGSGVTPSEVQEMIDESISGKADTSAVTAVANDVSTVSGQVATKVATSDFNTYTAATATAINGKVDTSAITTAITSGSTDDEIPTAKATYYAIQAGGGGSANVIELTQAQYDALSGSVDPSAIYVITDATAYDPSTKVDTSAITTSITSSSTNSEVAGAKAVYDAIQAGGGGGATYSAGYGINIDTGNTISFNMPITCTTNSNDNITIGNSTNNGNWSLLVGNDMRITNSSSAIGLSANDMSDTRSSISGNTRGVLIGCSNKITGGNINLGGGVAIGDRNESTDGGIVIGTASKASGSSTVAIGFSVNATGTTKMNLNNQIKVDTNNQVYIKDKTNTTDVCIQDAIAALGGLKFVSLSQSEYSAMEQAGTLDSNTLYIVSNVVS